MKIAWLLLTTIMAITGLTVSFAEETFHSSVTTIESLIKFSDEHRINGKEACAKSEADEAVNLARLLNPPSPLLLAKALNTQGNNRLVAKDYLNAVTTYQEALRWLSPLAQPQLQAHILINIAQLWTDVNQAGDDAQKQQLYQNDGKILLHQATQALQTALAATRNLPEAQLEDKARGLIHLSQLAKLIQTEFTITDPSLKLIRYQALREVSDLDDQKYRRWVSYANGYLGELYQADQRYPEAIQLTRQAIFLAQAGSLEEIYLWQRQLGQLWLAQGRVNEAIRAYQQAIAQLKDLRPWLTDTNYKSLSKPFNETPAGQVYLELIELLLQQAKQSSPVVDTQCQSYLLKAQLIVEQFREVELENYFKDECLRSHEPENKEISSTAINSCTITPPKTTLKSFPGTAVLYPIIFSEHLELLLQLPNDNRIIFTVPVQRKTIEKAVKSFKNYLTQKPPAVTSVEKLLTEAQKLYDWLIRPVETHLALAQVETLMVIPDGLLRSISWAALHDGTGYLIEKYALATAPNLTLIHPESRTQTEIDKTFLLNGLSVPPTGESLPSVKDEIEAIEKLYRVEKLFDQEFTRETFRNKLQEHPYSVIHIASHGKFESNPEESFLMTHHENLNLEDLKQIGQWGSYRTQPVDLLTLSACETGKGNDKAALGLSGIAVKAGVKSAVASLWVVNDSSTCYLMEAFYRQLSNNNPKLSLAKVLQLAQWQLLKGTAWPKSSPCGDGGLRENYKHPGYWAAFILIGNWL